MQQKQSNNNQNNSQNKKCNNNPCQQSCSAGLKYVGNIFLLGLATVVTELVDLQAARALETLLEPFRCDNGEDLEQDILAAGLEGSVADVDLLALAEQENL